MKVALLWIISDFPAYDMLSGWSTHERLSCPYCMERTKAFILRSGGKASFFDCHRQILPLDHQYRRQWDAFSYGQVERDVSPPRLFNEKILNRVCMLPDIIFGIQHVTEKLSGFGLEHN